MPPKKRKIDEDYVKPESYKKNKRNPPPEPWEPPTFEPFRDLLLQEQGTASLPPDIDPTILEHLFDLLFDSECVNLIVKATNSNAHANPPTKGPKWHDITPSDIYGYIGVLLYGAIYHIRHLDDLWATDSAQKPVYEAVRRCMGRDRFRIIDRYIHVSQAPQSLLRTQSAFQKIEQLSIRLQANCAAYWIAGRHLAVDECIQRFTGRSNATITIPTKPIPTGYKIWIIAEHGYVLNWLYHCKGEKYGPINLDPAWARKGYTKTKAVPLTLISRLPKGGRGSILYMDNLFMSTRLCRELRSLGVGSYSIVRLSKTAREEYDE